MLDYYERVEQEGIQKGIQKGIQEGREEGALMFIKNGHDIKIVSNVTKIPIERLEELVEEDKLSSKPEKLEEP
jgi:predicted transposase YdaD